MTEINPTPDNSPPVTVAAMLELGEQQFETAQIYFGHGTTSAWDEAVYLLSFVMNLPPDADRSLLDQVLTAEQHRAILELYQRRVTERIPAPYLTGTAWFCGLPFHVDERVIIPRSPLAELIYNGFQPWCESAPGFVLDLCTGSGCIGIACAYAFEQAEVVLSDISADALAVTQANILEHNVASRVTAVESDLFDKFGPSAF